jgi:hypothetical protein
MKLTGTASFIITRSTSSTTDDQPNCKQIKYVYQFIKMASPILASQIAEQLATLNKGGGGDSSSSSGTVLVILLAIFIGLAVLVFFVYRSGDENKQQKPINVTTTPAGPSSGIPFTVEQSLSDGLKKILGLSGNIAVNAPLGTVSCQGAYLDCQARQCPTGSEECIETKCGQDMRDCITVLMAPIPPGPPAKREDRVIPREPANEACRIWNMLCANNGGGQNCKAPYDACIKQANAPSAPDVPVHTMVESCDIRTAAAYINPALQPDIDEGKIPPPTCCDFFNNADGCVANGRDTFCTWDTKYTPAGRCIQTKVLNEFKPGTLPPKLPEPPVDPKFKPRQKNISDCGVRTATRGWYDVQGQGAKNDFCRFVLTEDGCTVKFACALAGSTEQKDFSHQDKWNWQFSPEIAGETNCYSITTGVQGYTQPDPNTCVRSGLPQRPKTISDCGLPNRTRGWYDHIRQSSIEPKNDYCRWVGDANNPVFACQLADGSDDHYGMYTGIRATLEEAVPHEALKSGDLCYST